MGRLMAAVIFSVLILGFIALVGCTKTEKVYVCPNGKETTDKSLCPTNKVAAVSKRDAENYAKRYVSAYFYGGKSQLVSSYINPDEGDYYATFVVSQRDEEPYETVVVIDGITGKVNCSENCDYT